MVKISKIKIEYYIVPITIFIVVVIVVSTALFYFFTKTKDLAKEYELIVGAIITLATTFAGISIPLSIDAANRKQDEEIRENEEKRKRKRTMAFMLGLIWNELRVNKTYLKDIEHIYDFDRFFVARFDAMLGGIWKQITSLNNLTEHIQDNSFIASQNSGAIVTYDNDDLFNAVQSAYEAISYFKFQMRMNLEDITIKNYALDKGYLTNISKQEAYNHSKTFQENLKKGKEELSKAIKSVETAIDMMDKKLNAIGVKVEEVDR